MVAIEIARHPAREDKGRVMANHTEMQNRGGSACLLLYCLFQMQMGYPQGYFQLHDTHIESIGIFYRPQPY